MLYQIADSKTDTQLGNIIYIHTYVSIRVWRKTHTHTNILVQVILQTFFKLWLFQKNKKLILKRENYICIFSRLNMLLSNIDLEVTFKCLDQNFYEKGKKISTATGILGHQYSFPVFLEHRIILTPLCQSQAGQMDAGQLVTISTFKPHLKMSSLTIYTVQRHSKGQAQLAI